MTDKLVKYRLPKGVILTSQAVSQLVKHVIPDSPVQPGVIHNPSFIK